MTFLIAGLPGGYELWIILIILLLLFGRRIPQVARSLGQGISQFKKGLAEPDAPVDETLPEGEKKDETKDEKSEEKAEA